MAKILVVDDSPHVRLLVASSLSRDGHIIMYAHDGIDALETLAREEFNVAIMDVCMPRLDGLTLCRMLRDDAGLQHLAIMIMSADASERAALLAGADAFLRKPFLPSCLRAVVETLSGSSPTAHE